jgi:hypothetical protein
MELKLNCLLQDLSCISWRTKDQSSQKPAKEAKEKNRQLGKEKDVNRNCALKENRD